MCAPPPLAESAAAVRLRLWRLHDHLVRGGVYRSGHGSTRAACERACCEASAPTPPPRRACCGSTLSLGGMDVRGPAPCSAGEQAPCGAGQR